MDMHILFVDENNSSRQNGIGTYRDMLIHSLHKIYSPDITLISLNAKCDTLTVNRRDYGNEYALPPVCNGKWRACGDVIWPLLRLYFDDSEHNIFIFNHSPSADFIRAMKLQFPKSKSIFVIHDQGWCAPLLGQRKLLSKVFKNRPMQVDTKGIEEYCKKELEIYEEVDKVVCLSKSTENILCGIYHVPRLKIVRIENGLNPSQSKRNVNREKIRTKFGLTKDEKIILYVGRPAYHKGVAALLEALHFLRQKNIAVRCVFVGNIHGFANYITYHKDIATNVILTGQLTKKELNQWYAIADAGVQSSYTEQCSYVALEMMNAGIPIVSSNGNGLCDMFSDDVNAFVAHINYGKNLNAYAKRLAISIEQALNAPMEQKKQYAVYNRHLLRTKYSASAMANKYMKLFRKLISAE